MFNRSDGRIDISDLEKSKIELEAMEFATQTRNRLGLSLYEPIDIIQITASEGIYVLQIKDLDCSGFIRVFDGKRVIFVNGSDSLGRQHYTIAHEYCHILRDLKDYAKYKEFSKEKYEYQMNKMEYFAYKFADFFLLPQSALIHALEKFGISDFQKITLKEVLEIQHYFQVSYLQMLRILRKFHILSETQHLELKMLSTKDDPQRIVNLTEKYGFSSELVTPLQHSRLPSEFIESIVDNIQNRRITYKKVKYLENLLKFPLEHFIPEISQEGDDE